LMNGKAGCMIETFLSYILILTGFFPTKAIKADIL